MTPADGAGFPLAERERSALPETQAILLHGGRALLLFEGAETQPPRLGSLVQGGRVSPWSAECWRVAREGGERWCGVAVLDALPAADAEILDAASFREWRLAAPPRVDIAPQPLADLVRRCGIDSRAVFGFLVEHLLGGRPSDCAEAEAHQAFARGFLTAAAERDGFIELLTAPESGGLFAQGWSLSLAPGATTLASVAGDLAMREVEVATFAREDILPPGKGVCFFGKSWREENLAALDAVFFEKNGRLLRLDVVHGAALHLPGAAAAAHVAQMLPRLEAEDGARRAFKRICRPRFGGVDTLSGTALPIAAAFDALLGAPDGTLLATGWLLDPLRRVERVLIKSTANLYAPVNAGWSLLPRPDLVTGFAADPRFAGLLDPQDAMHGFIVHAAARPEEIAGAQVYLELVLDDGSCLFRPLAMTPFESAERLPQILGALSPAEPELPRIVEEHLAPFLASVRPVAKAPRRGAARPIALGTETGPRAVSAVLPFRRPAELLPIFGLLAGSPEAEALDLTLVTSRAVATESLDRLGDAFRFYGLQGRLVIASDRETIAGRLDAGVAASAGAQVLCWQPAALPKAGGWLERLREEAAALPVPGLISPALTYEDGSIYFGGERAHPRAADAVCARSGYGGGWLHRGAPLRVSTGAAEIALIDREALARVGGFSGHLFSDAFGHVDLAARLRRAGLATYCSGAVEFWMLDDPPAAEADPFARLMEAVDAALLDRRGQTLFGDHRE